MPVRLLQVRWTSHAFDKAMLLCIARTDVEQVVLEQYHARRRNSRGGDWLVSGRRLAVVYNHPDRGDLASARIITLWRRR